MSDAVTLIKQKELSPDLVLCDYNLPGPMNGVESIKSLRAALAWNLPAIVMTGDTRSKTMEAVASSGVSVLVKPFLGDELIQLINRLCRSSESPDGTEAHVSLGSCTCACWLGTIDPFQGRTVTAACCGRSAFDYADSEVPVLLRMFQKRLRGYRGLGYARGEAPLGVSGNDLIIEYDEDMLQK